MSVVHTSKVIEDKPLHFLMAPPRVKVVFFHFFVGAVYVPALNRHAEDRGHRAGPVASARAMHVYGPILFVVDQGQELIRGVWRWIFLIAQREIDIFHSSLFGHYLRIIPGIVAEINDRFHADGRKLIVLAGFWLRASIIEIRHFTEVLNIDRGAARS